MAFNTALSGLKAANSDLSVTGNNIANASTVGFKDSRAEFSDVYAVSVLGTGSNTVGSGVLLADVSQNFTQGTINFTDRSLDLAVNGNGFFVLSDSGATQYTRAGMFGVDSEGFVVSNNGSRLQGFGATPEGAVIEGVLDDIQIQTDTQNPNQTTEIRQSFNVDSSEDVLLDIGNTTYSNGTAIALPQVGTGGNGYSAGTVDVDGVTYNIPSTGDLTAAQIAAELTSRNGVSASAITSASLTGVTFPVASSDMIINGVAINATDYASMASFIGTNLANMTAVVTGGGTGLDITSTIGQDIVVDVSGGVSSVTITGLRTQPDPTAPAPTVPLTITGGTANTRAVQGGELLLTLEDDTTLSPLTGDVFNIGAMPLVPFQNNTFDPTDQATYNHSTSQTVFDSLGNAHIATQYLVKEPSSVFGANTWSMYVQIDGEDVGDPDPNNLAGGPTQARYFMRFNQDGTLDEANSDSVVITNWTPLDSSGDWNGASLPINGTAGGATIPLPDPPTSSNFFLNTSGSTQFGTDFAVTSLSQNGYAAGQLAGVEVSDTGLMAARFTNGQTQILGQVVLASFTNQQGLTPLGDTSWAESFDSGTPIVGVAQTGNLGAVQAGALEDSNVDLSSELVQLIIAQRNFQANAKTIETSDTVTQTIINLR